MNDVTVKGSKSGGVLINGSTVTVNNITTEANNWGGIEVAQGNGVTSAAVLTVTGKSTHEDATGMAAIWTINKVNNDVIEEINKVIDSASQYTSNPDDRQGKEGFVNFTLK